jgi:hypothetical protein
VGVFLREVGALVTALMAACVLAPLGVMGMIAAGRWGVAEGLVASAAAALLLYLSAQSFLFVWQESPWTRHKDRPMLVGATILGSAGYSLLAFLAGMTLRGW